MNEQEIGQLNQEIVCQQLWNPSDCAYLSMYLNEDRYYIDRMAESQFSPSDGSEAIILGTAAAAAANTFHLDRPVVRAFISVREKIGELNRLIHQAVTANEVTAAMISVQNLASFSSHIAPHPGNQCQKTHG